MDIPDVPIDNRVLVAMQELKREAESVGYNIPCAVCKRMQPAHNISIDIETLRFLCDECFQVAVKPRIYKSL